jgi:DNA-binding MarR family transcriptional regulator
MNTRTHELARIARDWTTALVAADRPDLSARQMALLLTIYTEPDPQTIRSAAARLGTSKPAMTRATDRLEQLDLAKRQIDPMDRRSVLLRRTIAGAAYVRWAMGHLGDAIDEEARRTTAAAIESSAATTIATEAVAA